ncbi:MAG: NAD(P)/FAD-dependent oxidoreductase [Candidatus Limnocylindrales bacterium]
MAKRNVVIVGGGLAAARAATTLRKEGFDGRVLLLTEEPEVPYERPPLSKDYLRGTKDRAAIRVKERDAWPADAIEVLTSSRVVGLDLHGRSVRLEGGRRIRFWRAVLATGSVARALPVPGGDLPGVFMLRTVDEADALRAAALAAGSVIVVGGGWIGAEVAASLRRLGVEVTMVLSGTLPLEKVVGPEIGAVYRDLHRSHGVQLVPDARVEAVMGTGHAEGIRLADGRTMSSPVIVAGVGATPRVELARVAGLKVSDGVEVDELLRSSDPEVFAIGDIAAAWNPLLGHRIRVEHWDNARRQGIAVAKSVLDRGTPYARPPYFYSDQWDMNMEYVGHPARWDRLVFRGTLASGSFCAFWLDHGRIVAGLNARVDDVAATIAKLVESGATPDVARLTDPHVPLTEFLPPSSKAAAG